MGERKIEWTAREALACAYCWSEFHHGEDRDDTPEAYWQSITERARNDCRSVANRLMLLPIARSECVAMPPTPGFHEGQHAALMGALQLKAEHRLRQIYAGIFTTLRDRAFARRSSPTPSIPPFCGSADA